MASSPVGDIDTCGDMAQVEDEAKSWSELRQTVKESRRQYANLVCRTPTGFQFRAVSGPDGHHVVNRLYFLGMPIQSRENTLMFVDLPVGASHNDTQLPWNRLLDSSDNLSGMNQFSKEEQLLRERKRLDAFGITTYDYHDESVEFVFAACNSLFMCKNKDISLPVVPLKVPTDCSSVQLDPKICPCNPDWIAFVYKNDIWVTDIKAGGERRVSFAREGEGQDTKTAGVPSFIVQEEFNRYTGYWWQPSSQDKEKNIERILYEEVDEKGVLSVNILASPTDNQHLDEFKYPRAGTRNASCTLKIVELEGDSNNWAAMEIREKHLAVPLTTYFPWCEYIVRAGWTANGQVWCTVFDRRQGRMCLVLLPLDCFVTSDAPQTDPNDTSAPRIHVIYEETSYIWVKVHDLVHFFPQQRPDEITFIWGSEKTGFRHLYLVTASLAPISDVTMTPAEGARLPWELHDDDEIKAVIVKEQSLTSGHWEIVSHQLWVDVARGLVYFMAFKDSVLESHLYVTSYLHSQKPQRLTQPGFYHTVQLDETCSTFVTVYSSISQPPASVIYSLIHTDDGQVVPQLRATLLPPSENLSTLHCPSLFTYQSKAGHESHGMIFKPHNFMTGVKYPTMLFVYGGPEMQLVTNSFKVLKFLRLHSLAAEGYVIVAIDGRGSSSRGLQYEGWIKNRLGTVEIEEQVEGLQWIASQVDFIDLDRVAIHGWSYGGYLSLLGLAQRPDVFKLAISGAPVVQWTLYDTGYTERYMDLPDTNREGYKLGSVLSYVHGFPDEPNRLLIIHGLMDENVHVQHTMCLIEELVRQCKPYQLQVYPSERHGIRGVESNDHYKTTVLSFLQQHL